MKHQTATLEGALLDHAVAKALDAPRRAIDAQQWVEFVGGLPVLCTDIPDASAYLTQSFKPSADWQHGGPIIERERIGVYPLIDKVNWRGEIRRFGERGPTPLVAAMRAFVASKLGEDVEL